MHVTVASRREHCCKLPVPAWC